MRLNNRTLAVIVDELHTALKKEIADIVAIGALLNEAKSHVKHGEWLGWAQREFSMSDRTASKYMKAAEFTGKFELGSNLNLSPSALYLLSEDSYWADRHGRDEATEAVVKAAQEERVGSDRAKEIIDSVLTQNAKRKARQEAMANAMAHDMETAERDADERGERWGDKKDKWIEEWIAKNWGDEQEAKFEIDWQKTCEEAEQAQAAAEHRPISSEVEQRPPPHPSTVMRKGDTRPRGAAAEERDRRRNEGIDQLNSCIREMMKIVSAPVYDDQDRRMLRREHHPYLDGFIDEKGKRREPSKVEVVQPPVKTSADRNEKDSARCATFDTEHDLVA